MELKIIGEFAKKPTEQNFDTIHGKELIKVELVKRDRTLALNVEMKTVKMYINHIIYIVQAV